MKRKPCTMPMNFNLGPLHDRRTISISLPKYPESPSAKRVFSNLHGLTFNYKIGVLVSGGLDSAILYYLLLKLNMENNYFQITPYTILRKEGSKNYAIKVINHIHNLLNLNSIELNLVGNNTLPEVQQVDSGVKDILQKNDFAFVGIIEARPEHSIGWQRFKFYPTQRIKYPLLNLQKSHIVDLIYQNNLESILSVTHSCAIDELVPCGYCNGCNERSWGFKEMGRIDPAR